MCEFFVSLKRETLCFRKLCVKETLYFGRNGQKVTHLVKLCKK